MGLGQKLLTRVGSGQLSLVWVWIWKISPKNHKFFNFFHSKKISSSQVKEYPGQTQLGSYLLRVKSMLGSGQSPSLVYNYNLNW